MRSSERAWKGRKSDTGWFTLFSVVTGTWGVKYRVLNGMMTVMVLGSVTTTNNNATTYVAAQIPPELCPPTTARGIGYFNGPAGTLTVTTGGDVIGYQSTGVTQSTVSGTVMYPVN